MFSMKPHVNYGIERRGAGTPGSELYRRLSVTWFGHKAGAAGEAGAMQCLDSDLAKSDPLGAMWIYLGCFQDFSSVSALRL